MFNRITTAVVFAALATSSAASPASDRMAAKLDLDADKYTLNELVRISQVTGAERERVIDIIDKQREAFNDAVITAIQNGQDPFAVEVSRNLR